MITYNKNKKILIIGPPRTGTSMLFSKLARKVCTQKDAENPHVWEDALFEPFNHGTWNVRNVEYNGADGFADKLDPASRSKMIWQNQKLIKHLINKGGNVTMLDSVISSANIILATQRNFPDWALSLHLADYTKQFSNVNYKDRIAEPIVITENRIMNLYSVWLHTMTLTNHIINRYSTMNLNSVRDRTSRVVIPFYDNQFDDDHVNKVLNHLKIVDEDNVDFKSYTKKQLVVDPRELIKNYDIFFNPAQDLEISSKFTFNTNWIFGKPDIWSTVIPHIKDKPCHFCEIGSYEGRSTIWFIENFCQTPGSSMTCVDIKMRPNLLKNLSNINTLKLELNLINRGLDSNLEFKNKLTCCYIDGDHSYEGSLHDIETIWPNIENDGFVIFDDYDLVEIKDAVSKFMSSRTDAIMFKSNINTCIIRKTNK